jgi:mono/diheme cytochrome c family protein
LWWQFFCGVKNAPPRKNFRRDQTKLFMKIIFFAALSVIAAGGLRAEPAADALVKRGQYLVESAGACADCHTPRDWRGRLDRDRWLQGAKLDFKPARLMPWADTAPGIAGLPAFSTDAEAVKYFETGTNRAGKASSPPMPQYRFNHDDALALVAYLRSLKPGKN